MGSGKYLISDVKRALEYLEKNNAAIDVRILVKDFDRLEISYVDQDANNTIITVYPVERQKMPDITKTDRLY